MDLWHDTEKECARWTVHERAEKDWWERPGRPGAREFTEDKGGVSSKKDETVPRSKAVARHCEFGINLCSWDLINCWTFVCHNKGSFSERTWLGALRVGQSLRAKGWGWIADEMEALHLIYYFKKLAWEVGESKLRELRKGFLGCEKVECIHWLRIIVKIERKTQNTERRGYDRRYGRSRKTWRLVWR